MHVATRKHKNLFLLHQLPFIAFLFYAAPVMDTSVLLETREPDVVWAHVGKMLLVAYWNLSGWDCVSTIAGEIDVKSLPKALNRSLFLVVAQYIVILSLCAAAGAGVAQGFNGASPIVGSGQELDWRHWTDGSIPKIVESICGSWMGAALLG